MLKPGGKVVPDVVRMGSFAPKHEGTIVESNLMGGFWAEGDYVGMQRTILYPDEALSLDRVLIIEPTESWQIFNRFQYFTPQRLSEEFGEARFNWRSNGTDGKSGGARNSPMTYQPEKYPESPAKPVIMTRQPPPATSAD